MRKILFRILIAVLLFLLIVLGVAYYRNDRPLNVIKSWAGVNQDVIVQTQTTTRNTTSITTGTIKTSVQTGTTTTGSATSGKIEADMPESAMSDKLSSQDKKDVKSFVNGVIIK